MSRTPLKDHENLSNEPRPPLGDYLADPTLAAALLDRFLHHCHVLNISGESFRLKEKAKRSSGTGRKRDSGKQGG